MRRRIRNPQDRFRRFQTFTLVGQPEGETYINPKDLATVSPTPDPPTGGDGILWDNNTPWDGNTGWS